MLPDTIAAAFYTLLTISSSFIAIQIRKGNFPAWCTFLTSIGGMFIWSWVVRNSKLPLPKASALYDFIGSVVFFLGLLLQGEAIGFSQWIGVMFLTIGMYLICH